MKRCLLVLFTMTLLTGCLTFRDTTPNLLDIPCLQTSLCLDGVLDDACYTVNPPLIDFGAAGEPTRPVPLTAAWLFWTPDALVCAFACDDPSPAWAPASSCESEVDGQDRVEVFLWPGESSRAYYCIEAAPGDALHDYKAMFYREFDHDWSPLGGWVHKAQRTPTGYTVEMMLPRTAIEGMRMRLEKGFRFRLGLFRADFDVLNGTPTWITWVDHGRKPDFHVASSFGTAVLRHKH